VVKSRLTIAIAVLIALLAGCSGSAGSDGDDLQGYVAAVMATQLDDSEVPVTDGEGRCIAGRTFDEIGPDRFLELGFDSDSVTPQAMSSFDELWADAEWELLIDALFNCVDMEKRLQESIGADQDIDDDAAACIAEGYFESGYLRITMLQRDQAGPEVEDAFAELADLFQRCSTS